MNKRTEGNTQYVNNQFFTKELTAWNKRSNKRKMPWKGIDNPYFIWLSEIILQQTRVEQGTAYYNKFITKYPFIEDLAGADDEVVFKDWEGLGYYNRCRNMLATARRIVDEFGGVFPNNYDTILSLKGVGPYTAAAIASFAFGLPYAVVDGNVIRVLSRFFGIEVGFEKAKDKKHYEAKAQDLLDKKKPAAFNQAIMDFGAKLCMPQNPLCNTCPLSKKCYALKNDRIAELPLKKKKLAIKNRYFHYLIIHAKKGIYIKKREEKDIWQGLYEFYLQEQKATPKLWSSAKKLDSEIQLLSHQKIHSTFYEIRANDIELDMSTYHLVNVKDLKNYAFPRSLVSFLERFDYI